MWSSMQLSHRLYKLKPFTLTSEMMWHLECGTDFEVNRKCKKNCPILWQMDQKNTGLFLPRRPLVETSIFAIRGNAEFFSYGMRKMMRGNLQNVPHLIFRKLPLATTISDSFVVSVLTLIPPTFRIPQSAFRKIPAPCWTSAHIIVCRWIRHTIRHTFII